MASVGYFEVLRARLLQGRYFEETDNTSSTKVAVINRTMAQEEFPGEAAVGKSIINQYDSEHPIEIVGGRSQGRTVGYEADGSRLSPVQSGSHE
jgi:hypothetical protein